MEDHTPETNFPSSTHLVACHCTPTEVFGRNPLPTPSEEGFAAKGLHSLFTTRVAIKPPKKLLVLVHTFIHTRIPFGGWPNFDHSHMVPEVIKVLET